MAQPGGQPAPNGATWLVTNPSPLEFADYHDMPKNPEHFCTKYQVHDPIRSAEDHIKMFEDHLRNRQIAYADVACRLFPYSLGEEAHFWFIHLPVGSIRTWEQMKEAFIGKFGIPITPVELFRQFTEVRRQDKEPIHTFNNRFQKALTRLRPPYMIPDARENYYAALDPLTAMFIRQAHPIPADMNQAYAKAVEVSQNMGQNITGPSLYTGLVTTNNQMQTLVPAWNQQIPSLNPVPQPAYHVTPPSDQLILHPGVPLSQTPTTQPVYL